MFRSVDHLLDAAKAALDCATDSELAAALGVGATRICNYRKRRSFPNSLMVRRLAHALEVPAALVVAAVRRERELDKVRRIRDRARRIRAQSAQLRAQARRLRERPASPLLMRRFPG